MSKAYTFLYYKMTLFLIEYQIGLFTSPKHILYIMQAIIICFPKNWEIIDEHF